MGWSRFIFWFFLVVMLPLSVVLAISNFVTGNIPMLVLNLITIALSVFNIYTSHQTINRWKSLRNSILTDQIYRNMTGVK